MKDERVGFDHLHGAAAMVNGVAVVELHRAQVGKEEDARGHLSYLEGVGLRGFFQGHTLGAQSHGDASRLRGLGQAHVDAGGLFRPSGHGRDEQGGAQPLAENGRAQVNLVQVQLRQCPVDNVISLEARGQPGELHIFLQVDAYVVGFTNDV